MKKYVLFIMALLVCGTVCAQENKDRKKKFDIDQHRIMQHKFMSEKAGFTTEDSLKFFAIYDEMRQKEYNLFADNQQLRRKRPETDEECLAAMLHRDSVELQLKQLQMDYHKRMAEVVSPAKVVRALIFGEEFDRQTLREMNRHEPRPENMDKNDHKGKKYGKNNKRRRPHGGPRPGEPRPEDPRPEINE